MKQITCIAIISFLLTAGTLVVSAQKNTTAKSSAPRAADTATQISKNKMEKVQMDADNYTRAAEAAKTKLKILFPTKPGDTVYAVIPNISYADPNLKMFKEQLDAIKSTKGLTSSYRAGNAVIKVVYKGGNASKLYDLLSDQVKEIFPADDIEGNRIILNYALAKPAPEPAAGQNQ
ncbi:MAG: hypothetical protein ABI675_03300 [Chitinophagaceae bacterium]